MEKTSLAALLFFVLALDLPSGSASGQGSDPVAVLRAGEKPFRPGSDGVLVLPCDASGFWGTGVDHAACSRILSEKAPTTWGAGAVPLEPLAPALEKEGLGNLAWRLAIGAWHVWEEHQSFDLAADPCRRGIDKLPREMERVAALAKGMPGIKAVPRFVLALHVGCRGPGEKPDTLKLRLLACLWDLEAGKAHTIVQRIEEARAADVLARMSCIPAEAALLAARHAAPAKEADPSKPLKTPWKMQVEARKGATPIDLAKEKVLLLPCGPWGFAGAVDEAATGAALLAGTVSFFGESGISLAPMGPVFEAAGLNAMSYRLCYGAYHVADFHEQFTLDDGCGVGIEEVPVMVNKAVGLAVEKLALPGPFPDYLFGLAVVSLGEQKPGVLKYRVIACVYDLVSKQVHTVAWASRETAKDAMLAEMAVLPGEVFEQLGEVAFKRP